MYFLTVLRNATVIIYYNTYQSFEFHPIWTCLQFSWLLNNCKIKSEVPPSKMPFGSVTINRNSRYLSLAPSTLTNYRQNGYNRTGRELANLSVASLKCAINWYVRNRLSLNFLIIFRRWRFSTKVGNLYELRV